MSVQEKPQDIESWLDALGAPSADRDYKPGHARIQTLITKLEVKGLTFRKPKLRVRIAGTNGKGSTANFLATALQANGFKVGLYTSPHILEFHERMRIDGEPIKQDTLLKLMAVIMPLALDVGTSYFETATVLALLYFSQQHVDVEILEAGVGAKLDATTAVPADMALLTPIALDHQAWLGDTLAEIAQEKAYVFRGCEIQLSALQSSEVKKALKPFTQVMYAPSFEGKLDMAGQHQYTNAGLAYAGLLAVMERFPNIDLTRAKDAMTGLNITGRLQPLMFQKHSFVLDAAHNEHAVQALLPTLQQMEPFDIIFVATREDRDLSHILDDLQACSTRLIALTGDRQDEEHIQHALQAEVSKFEAGHFLVLGSFVTLAKTLRWMKNKNH